MVGAVVTHADGYGERAAALAMLDTLPGRHPRTIAADKAYDTRDFVQACRERRVTPHVASHETRWGGSAIDARTTRHPGYAVSQTKRKRIEEHFGWGKTVGRIRQTVHRGDPACGPAVQVDDDGEQHRANGADLQFDAAGDGPMR